MNQSLTKPFISVIIPVYIDQQGIDACLTALAAQSWPKDRFEVIVIDNGSPKPIRINTDSKLNIRLEICHKPGSYAARNAGTSISRGDILAFTDADCIPDENWIKSGVEAIQKSQGLSIIGGDVCLTLPSHPTAIERYQCLTGFLQKENIEQKGFTATANLFATRAQIEKTGPFDENLLSGGDREWSWRTRHNGYSIIFSPEAKVYTPPRTTLRGAIKQARRVAGGRRELRKLGLSHVEESNLKSHRTNFEAIVWILHHPDLSPMQRIKVFAVASILKIAQLLESLRLSLGLRSERG